VILLLNHADVHLGLQALVLLASRVTVGSYSNYLFFYLLQSGGHRLKRYS
jgi:hypothetical protein